MLKTQNLCCPKTGPANTRWKLVRRPRREMGSFSLGEKDEKWFDTSRLCFFRHEKR